MWIVQPSLSVRTFVSTGWCIKPYTIYPLYAVVEVGLGILALLISLVNDQHSKQSYIMQIFSWLCSSVCSSGKKKILEEMASQILWRH
jgi:hypothetical protein